MIHWDLIKHPRCNLSSLVLSLSVFTSCPSPQLDFPHCHPHITCTLPFPSLAPLSGSFLCLASEVIAGYTLTSEFLELETHTREKKYCFSSA